MAKIKRLILGLIPNQKCNLKCEYCYISQLEAWDEPEKMHYSVEHIAKCMSVKRLGGVCLINLTGNGETLLNPEVVDIAKALLREGHFVEIVTNLTATKRIKDLLDAPKEHVSRLFFKCSFHYKELKRLGLMDRFFSNVEMIKNAGASFTVELMAYDEIEKDIDDIISITKENVGAVCQATIGRNEHKDAGLLSIHTVEEFKKIWSPLNSPMMELKLEMLSKKRTEFCYAGAWSMFVNMYTGESQPCYWQPYNQNIFANPDKPIKFDPVGHSCTQPFCVNAHAHMTWGLIPELKTPTYCTMRNREIESGGSWLNEECTEFFSSKLSESNEEYSGIKKALYSIVYPFRMLTWFLGDGKNNYARVKKHATRKIRWFLKKGE